MTTDDTTASNASLRRLTCQDCGADFTCSLGGGCWCDAEPARLPLPAAGDCLCPACLRKAAAAVAEHRR